MQKPTERLKRKVEKENLWYFIIAVLKKHGTMAGHEIKKILKDELNLSVGMVTSYKVLYLLEKGGYVKRIKKGKMVFYQATDKGLKEFEKARELFKVYSSLKLNKKSDNVGKRKSKHRN